jgi:Family of unknown function (DUF6655)
MDVARFLGLLLPLAGIAAGCTTAQTSNTARTATEQLLISDAVDHALDKVDFDPFVGRRVYLDEKYVDCVDKNYVVASLRHRLLNAGAALVPAADNADIVMELRAGGVGTTSSDSFVGIPEITVPGMLTLPEIRMMSRSRQEGTAKLGIVAYDAHTGQILGPGGMSVARSTDNNWFVAGVGPYRNGTLKEELRRSTSGRAAWSKEPLPEFVTFDTPPRCLQQMHEMQEIQLTSGSEPAEAEPQTPPQQVVTADAEVPAEQQPDWARH